MSATSHVPEEMTGAAFAPHLPIRYPTNAVLGIEELEYKSHYEHALREGHFVIVVQAPTDGRKARATDLLRECGAHSLSFHGRFMIEELSPATHA